MTLINKSGAQHRSTAGVLADIAHELSSTSEWATRLEDAVSMLCDIIPANIIALGVQLYDWNTFFYPDPEVADQIEEKMLEHYGILTGVVPGAAAGSADYRWDNARVISETEDDVRSFLSLPVIGAGQVIGVLHVCVEANDAYSPDDVSVLSIVALQIGSYIKNIQAQMEGQAREQELERLRADAERRRAELESFISSTTDGVLLFDAQGKTLMINEAARAIFGQPLDEPFDKWAGKLKLHTLDDCPMSLKESAPMRALHGETVKDARYKLITRVGREITLGISASPVKDSSGRIQGVVNIFRDISEEMDFQKRTQELFEREHHIAQMLQQALIPPQLEYDIDSARIAVRYQPALKEAEVGGDFYDVFRLGDGRIGILIGDVAGKGLQAAIRVAAARYAVRSYAYLDSSPAVVMTLVNELLCRDEPGADALMTAIYAVIDTAESTITYASGGHEPPMVRKADGQIEDLPEGGRALGVYGGFTYTEASRKLESGETVIIVTDGIIEARLGSVLFGTEGVKDFLTSHRHLSPSQTASALLNAATQHAGGALQDDAAIVILELQS